MQEWLEDFRSTIDSAAERLRAIDEAHAAQPRTEDHWSSKQIIGHLIDSATNNHERGPSQNATSASLRAVVFATMGSAIENCRDT